MTTAATWTKPFHGVQHLGEPGSGRSWVSVTDYGTFTELSCWFPGSGFYPMVSNHDTAEQARADGEKWLSQQRQPA